ncbi:MAG: hydantoinase B/oxoprolinase family protein [Sphingomonadaceae bacterium]|nr:hydantoinase B/oxoprolinase family protein [Sphingomonadaceae bacterium]
MSDHAITTASDLVTEEVVRMAIRQITEEMASVLTRISGSPAITEADDFTVLIYSAKGELLDAPRGPVYTGSAGRAMKLFLAEFGDGGFEEGDTFLGNDPFTAGAMHANDVQTITPVFQDGTCIGFCYLHAHMLDVGGIVPGSWGVGATDCFGEAFRVPFVKYVEKGRVNETVKRIIARNTRLPGALLNDLRGMAAAGEAGARQYCALVDRYGRQRFEAILDAIIARSERAGRHRLAALPEGNYEVVDWMEHNGHVNDLYEVRGRLIVADRQLRFEFTGVPQTNGLINSTGSGLVGFLSSAVVMMLLWDLPVNEGVRRVFEVAAAPGTIVCAVEPAPVSSGHMDGSMKILTCTTRLLSQAMERSSDPELRTRACAPYSASASIAVFAGLDRGGTYHVFADMTALATGGGASPVRDGLDAGACQAGTSLRMPDVESYEQAYPVLFLWRALAPDSGGAGLRRGGVGLDAAWTLWGADEMTGITNAASWQIPVPGIAGGYPGGATKIEHVEAGALASAPGQGGALPTPAALPEGRSIAAKSNGIHLKQGDVWRQRYPGGAGWGDPLDRAAEDVVADVRMGAVTPAAARDAYGVVLTAEGNDAAATGALRTELRAARRAAAAGDGRRRMLAEALAQNGAFAFPRADLELVERIDAETARSSTCATTSARAPAHCRRRRWRCSSRPLNKSVA